MMRRRLGLALGLVLISHDATAQADPLDLATGFDGTPWISARAAALSETLSTTANGLDAFYYNPALIGGFRDKTETPFVTHLYFPYLGSSASDGGDKILADHLTGDSLDKDNLAVKLKPSANDVRPYARISATPLAIFERAMLGYTYNTRIASYQNNEDPAKPATRIEERTMSGPFLGFSAIAPKDEFYMGVSAAFLKSTETVADWDEATETTAEARKASLSAGKMSYEGLPIHLGMLYRFKPSYKPSISLVVNDIGSTRYSPSDKTQTTEIQKERATLGFSVSPAIQTWGRLHLTAEATDLTRSDVQVRDKLRMSTEFNMGSRYGADSGLSLRMGYAAAGLSYGAGFNFGILSAQIASYAEDIGAGSARVIERRSVVNVGINIADY